MFRSSQKKTLRGGGIEAEVIITSHESFKVTGHVKEIK
jgi:hypothetical protein